MTRTFDYMPGVPAAGHLTGGGYWHPGAADNCNRCHQPTVARRRIHQRTQLCEWFAMCDHPADGIVQHPVLGAVPTCNRCAKRFGLELIIRVVDGETGELLHLEGNEFLP